MGDPSGLVAPDAAASESEVKYSEVKCVSGFSSAADAEGGMEAWSLAIAPSSASLNSGEIVDGGGVESLLLLEHSASFSVVEENVVDVDEEEAVVRIESVLWWVENAAAVEHDALRRRAVERMLLENFMVTIYLLLRRWFGCIYEHEI